MKYEILGADAGGIASFVPYLSIISSLAGGGSSSAKSGDSDMMKMMLMQKQIADEKAKRDAETRNMMIIAGLGVATLGTVLYLFLKK